MKAVLAPLTFTAVTVVTEGLNVGYREHLLGKLAKINLRLAKLGAPAATISFGPIVERTETAEGTGWTWTVEEFETVTVTGVEAQLAGWAAVASLDHSLAADEAFVTRFPGHFDDEIPARFRFTGPACDHCQLKIARNLTVLFRHDDGRWTQVGTTCVLDYLGVDPATVLWLAAAFNSAGEVDEDAAPKGGKYVVTPGEFVAAAAEVTRLVGFVPSASTTGWSTRDQACQIVAGKVHDGRGHLIWPDLDQSKGAAAAALIVEWVAAQSGASDFMANAKIAVRADRVTARTEGILASLPSVYGKAMERDIAAAVDKAAQIPSAHIGTVGSKLTVVGTVIVERTFDGHFGLSKLIVVKLDTGEEVATIGSGSSLFGLDKGDRVQFTGKVSAHEDGQYGKRTMVKMAKAAVLHADGTPLPDAAHWISRAHAFGDHEGNGAVEGGGACYHCVKAWHDEHPGWVAPAKAAKVKAVKAPAADVPADYAAMTPGQKAAFTRKQKALVAA